SVSGQLALASLKPQLASDLRSWTALKMGNVVVSGNVNLGLDGVTAQITVDALDLNLAKDPSVAAGQIVPRLDWTRAFDLNGNTVYGDAGDLLHPGAELPTPVN